MLITILLVTLSPFLSGIYALPNSQEQQNVDEQMFMEMVTHASGRVDDLRDLVLGVIGSVPSAIEDLLDEADALLAEGGMEKAKQAMSKYRNAYRQLYSYLRQHGVDMEAPERVRRMLQAMNRTYTRIERLNKTANSFNSTLDPTDPYHERVQKRLEWVWENLTEAVDNLELANQSLYSIPPNITWAAHNLTEAKNNTREAHTTLRLVAFWTNYWRFRNFFGELKERIRVGIQRRQQQGGFNLTASLEKLGVTDLENYYEEIRVLMEDARQNPNPLNQQQILMSLVSELTKLMHWTAMEIIANLK